jgi:hypothetical protein
MDVKVPFGLIGMVADENEKFYLIDEIFQHQ